MGIYMVPHCGVLFYQLEYWGSSMKVLDVGFLLEPFHEYWWLIVTVPLAMSFESKKRDIDFVMIALYMKLSKTAKHRTSQLKQHNLVHIIII